MVAVVPEAAATAESQNSTSTTNPLLLSEKDTCDGLSSNQKKPKSRIVSSRYMSPFTSPTPALNSLLSSSKRSPSPLVSRNLTQPSNGHSPGAKRSASVDRRRPAASRSLSTALDFKHCNNTADVSAAAKLLVTSTRRLSVSFQGEGFSLPVSKTKVTPPPNSCNGRKGTPERRRTGTPLRGKGNKGGDQTENSKLVDLHRWPTTNSPVNSLCRSLNYGTGEERGKLIGSDDIIRGLRESIIDERRHSLDGRLGLGLGNSKILKSVQDTPDGNSVYKEPCLPSDHISSDSESVSSGSNSGVQECGEAFHGPNGSRAISSLARFWQETNSRLGRLHDPGSPSITSPGSKQIAQPKSVKHPSDYSIMSPPTMLSPVRGGSSPASSSKLATPVGIGSYPSRGHSPSRIRNAVSTIRNSFVETPSVLSFAVDVRRGKIVENQIVDAHVLRLLYNRHLQWRIVNARTDASLLVQNHNSEKNLWNAWITISDLRDTVTKKRHRLQLLRQKLKLSFVLKGQMTYLEDWASLDKDHSFSMLGATESLKASTLRLPAVGGTTVDISSLKDAISSALAVLQAITSSMHSFQPMVEEVNSLATELAKVTATERGLLQQCTDSISSVAAIQVKDCSMRTQMLQHNHTPNA